MLDYREINYQNDISSAVSLIKKGLDSNYTEAFFRWKHLENPFGKSYGLVAIDKGKIIGLRMFMFWKFLDTKQNKVISAIRPVDTVIDKDYRGLGLFKQLTLKGLENCEGKYDLIFNTPNENSLPGYLKMGWKQLKTGCFKLGFALPSFSKTKINFDFISIKEIEKSSTILTFQDSSYLDWRFKNKEYKTANLKGASIIYNIHNAGRLNKIVIQEIYGKKNHLKELIRSLARFENSFLIYYYENDVMDEILPIKFKRNKSVVVVKNDALKVSNDLIFSLGDLEGKL